MKFVVFCFLSRRFHFCSAPHHLHDAQSENRAPILNPWITRVALYQAPFTEGRSKSGGTYAPVTGEVKIDRESFMVAPQNAVNRRRVPWPCRAGVAPTTEY